MDENIVINRDKKMKNRKVLDYLNGLTYKQKKVFEILVCPIVASKRVNKVSLYTNKFGEKIILSSQAYDGNLDEDMCDLSIRFYEILFGLEEGYILKQVGTINDWNYAGDTMNSYNFISQFLDKREKEAWYESYHCLANFWVLPGEIGRGSSKAGKSSGGRHPATWTVESFNNGKKDFVDRYLCEEWFNDERLSNKTKWLEREAFCEKNFLYGSYINKESNEVQKFSEINGKNRTDKLEAADVNPILDKMMNHICERAVLIVSHKDICNKLCDYFDSLNLI